MTSFLTDHFYDFPKVIQYIQSNIFLLESLRTCGHSALQIAPQRCHISKRVDSIFRELS